MKRIHLAIAAAAIVAVLVIAGAAIMGARSDSFPKKAVLKVHDVELITELQGNWTQELLDSYENTSSPPYGAKHAASSGVRCENATGTVCSFVVTVAEMSSAQQAEEQYHVFVSQEPFQNESFWVQTSLGSLGDGAVMFTSPPIIPVVGCWIIFHKGVYLVTMLGLMDATECQSIMLRLAEAQADRLP